MQTLYRPLLNVYKGTSNFDTNYPGRRQFDMEAMHYSGADKSLAQPASRCILFDDENISFDASLVIYR
jgi:hypothetical protein